MNRSNIKPGDKIIAWSSEYKHYFKVSVTKLNAKTFQGSAKDVEKLVGLQYEQAWKPEEFKKQRPEEYYSLFPEQKPTEVVEVVQPIGIKVARPDTWFDPPQKRNFEAESNGQITIFEALSEDEPPEPDDFNGDLEAFAHAWDEWLAEQRKVATTIEEIFALDQLILSKEKWNQSNNGNGLTYVAESVLASLSQESDVGVDRPIHSLSGMTGAATQFSENGSPMPEDLATSKSWTLGEKISTNQSISLQPALPANHSQLMEDDSQPMMNETVSPPSSTQLMNCDPSSQLSKMFSDFSAAQLDQGAIEPTSKKSLTSYPKAGTMSNGNVSAAPSLERSGVGKDCLLLRSPGALSGDKNKRPPGQSRLDHQLKELGMMQAGEVCSPEFLEAGYNLPIGLSNPSETRTAMDLAQAQDLKSELLPATESTAIAESPSETLLTGELQVLDSAELNILPALQNLGFFNKDELLSIAREQHQFICGIERKEFGLAIEKLHRVRATGICLQEFKRRCEYGEFENELEQAGISIRSSQNYMTIAKNWDIVEAKTKLVSLLQEESQHSLPAIGLKWALEAVRDEKKHLKSGAPPADPDSWRTSNTAIKSVAEELKELGAAVGLSNGKSILPDLRDSDRELMERYDPNTVDDRPFTSTPARSAAIAQDRFELPKQNCLKDYILAVSSSLSDFSDEQIAFLAKIINEESAKRICGF